MHSRQDDIDLVELMVPYPRFPVQRSSGFQEADMPLFLVQLSLVALLLQLGLLLLEHCTRTRLLLVESVHCSGHHQVVLMIVVETLQ